MGCGKSRPSKEDPPVEGAEGAEDAKKAKAKKGKKGKEDLSEKYPDAKQSPANKKFSKGKKGDFKTDADHYEMAIRRSLNHTAAEHQDVTHEEHKDVHPRYSYITV